MIERRPTGRLSCISNSCNALPERHIRKEPGIQPPQAEREGSKATEKQFQENFWNFAGFN
jgi:hypothetical protein